MSNIKSNVFLSHSSKDKEFAWQLNASLIAAGVDTFLDEKNILVGESIPEKLYEGIASSTHLIYIISENSIKSKWVQEELSIAKMLEKQSEGFRILPLLLDNVNLPASIIHIKHADFTQWRNPNSYRQAFLQLLYALGIEPRLLDSYDLSWYARYSGEIREIQRILFTVYGEVTGGLDATQFSTRSAYMTIKNALTYWNVEDELKKLHDNLLADIEPYDKTRLTALKDSVAEALKFIDTGFEWDNQTMADQFRRILRIIVNMIEEIRTEIEVVLLATFKIREDD